MKAVWEYSVPDSTKLFGDVEPEVPASVAEKLAAMPPTDSYIPRAISGWLDEVIRSHAQFRNN
ncbi:MAG: hypothetical protein KF713_07155 [Turneriella sp.]|nr:hypothetical protein [Turneriella sp.]